MTTMSQKLATIPQADMTALQVAEVFVQSGMFPDAKSVATAASKLIVGRDLGLTDYDSMAGLHIIQGKVELAACTMAAAIKASGKYDYRAKTNETKCAITFYENTNGGKEEIGTTTFTIDDAKNAGLLKNNVWQKYPKAMLFARAISAGYKEHCPDAIGKAAVYVREHGESEIPENPKVTVAPQRETPQIEAPTPPEQEDEMSPKEKLVFLVNHWCGCETNAECYKVCEQVLTFRDVPVDGSAEDTDILDVIGWVEDNIANGTSFEESILGDNALAEEFEIQSIDPKPEVGEDPWGE